jgi:hypothetical protein
MKKWKKFSRDPLRRVKIAYTEHSSIEKWVNCGRVLTNNLWFKKYPHLSEFS